MEQTQMQEVTMLLSPQAVRMMRGYSTLSGKPVDEITAELGMIVSDSLVKELRKRIAGEIDLQHTPEPNVGPMRVTKVATQPMFADTTGISDGLGDEEPPEPETIKPSEETEAEGGLTDEDLEDDMRVEDASTEAKVEAPKVRRVEEPAETTFMDLAGFTDERILKRKKKPGGKGRVTPLSQASFADEVGL